ncbi:uncharacterized protein YALI1_C28063g [Yarrowia lipolytica]|uniref:DNA directed RNA polymerase n=1 Tax=Yarrowia lipolytica TaxID=4952 RepID=A0A1D8NBY5_YARLL|nr:hypothetical protein YALI1_C28063g [Yarrowia lipolytica]
MQEFSPPSSTLQHNMNKESFSPSLDSQNLSASASGVANNKSYAVKYLCANCSSKVVLIRGDPVRCKECGHRVLYKERANYTGE